MVLTIDEMMSMQIMNYLLNGLGRLKHIKCAAHVVSPSARANSRS